MPNLLSIRETQINKLIATARTISSRRRVRNQLPNCRGASLPKYDEAWTHEHCRDRPNSKHATAPQPVGPPNFGEELSNAIANGFSCDLTVCGDRISAE